MMNFSREARNDNKVGDVATTVLDFLVNRHSEFVTHLAGGRDERLLEMTVRVLESDWVVFAITLTFFLLQI